MITSVKTVFPSKVTLSGTGGQDFNISFCGEPGQPLTPSQRGFHKGNPLDYPVTLPQLVHLLGQCSCLEGSAQQLASWERTSLQVPPAGGLLNSSPVRVLALDPIGAPQAWQMAAWTPVIKAHLYGGSRAGARASLRGQMDLAGHTSFRAGASSLEAFLFPLPGVSHTFKFHPSRTWTKPNKGDAKGFD